MLVLVAAPVVVVLGVVVRRVVVVLGLIVLDAAVQLDNGKQHAGAMHSGQDTGGTAVSASRYCRKEFVDVKVPQGRARQGAGV